MQSQHLERDPVRCVLARAHLLSLSDSASPPQPTVPVPPARQQGKRKHIKHNKCKHFTEIYSKHIKG